MSGGMLAPVAGAGRAVAAWLDFAVALSAACVERLRVRGTVSPSSVPPLVARAITVDGELAVVYRLQPSRGRFAIGPVATVAIAAAALASTLGAGTMFSFGFGEGVAALAGQPVIHTLAGAQQQARTMVPPGPARDGLRILAPRVAWQRQSAVQVSLLEPFVMPASGTVAVPSVEIEQFAPFSPTSGQTPAEGSRALVSADLPTEGSATEADDGGLDSQASAAAPVGVQPEPTRSPAAGQVSLAAPSGDVPGALPAFRGIAYTEKEVRALAVEAGWEPEHLDELVLIAWCESRFMPAARGQWALGLMQLMPFWFEVAGEDVAEWSNPVTNLKVARVAYEADLTAGKDPWAAWQCLPVGAVTAAGN